MAVRGVPTTEAVASGRMATSLAPQPAVSRCLRGDPAANVTGSLHLGHAMDNTPDRHPDPAADAGLRRAVAGRDGPLRHRHPERRRAPARDRRNSRHDSGRERFVDKVWDWERKSGGAILGQMRRLSDGVGWSRERFTPDEGLSRAVQTIFKRLFAADLRRSGSSTGVRAGTPPCRTSKVDHHWTRARRCLVPAMMIMVEFIEIHPPPDDEHRPDGPKSQASRRAQGGSYAEASGPPLLVTCGLS